MVEIKLLNAGLKSNDSLSFKHAVRAELLVLSAEQTCDSVPLNNLGEPRSRMQKYAVRATLRDAAREYEKSAASSMYVEDSVQIYTSAALAYLGAKKPHGAINVYQRQIVLYQALFDDSYARMILGHADAALSDSYRFAQKSLEQQILSLDLPSRVWSRVKNAAYDVADHIPAPVSKLAMLAVVPTVWVAKRFWNHLSKLASHLAPYEGHLPPES